MVFTVWQVEQDAPELAAKLENFLVARLERIEKCEGQNSGMKYDADTGECIVGECGAGSYKVYFSCRSPALVLTGLMRVCG